MTRDILDAIDGALDDWETSADAMRWRPPEDRPPRLGIPLPSTSGAERELGPGCLYYLSDDGQRHEICAQIQPILAADYDEARVIHPFPQAQRSYSLGVNIPGLGEILRKLAPTVDEIKARALTLRRTRNTGPTKPPPGSHHDRRQSRTPRTGSRTPPSPRRHRRSRPGTRTRPR